MPEKRQRSKQRQAERRAQRLAGRGADAAAARSEPEREEDADRAVGAPPKDLGHPEYLARHEDPPAPDFEADDDGLFEEEDAQPAAAGPRGVRGARETRERGEHRERGRLLEFLKAVWAELQRVQWPDRKTLTQLTGVVLFFVVIVGAYLGALDAIFSQLIKTIL